MPSPNKHRLGRIVHPIAQERAYARALRPFADDCFSAMVGTYFPHLFASTPGHYMDGLRHDLDKMAGRAERQLRQAWPKERIAALSEKAAAETNRAHEYQFKRVMAPALKHKAKHFFDAKKEVPTAKVYIHGLSDEQVHDMMKGFVRENVGLIESIAPRYFGSINNKVNAAVHEGKSVETLAKELRKSYHITRSHADLIARDQVGKLFGQLNKERQQAAGIGRYIWRTMEDERVREEHAELDGEEFSWDDAPAEGHPGEAIQCRCTAEPILED